VAWCTIGGQGHTPSDIKVYHEWPVRATSKVPSILSFSKTSHANRSRQWGHDIEAGSRTLQWTKLDLAGKTATKNLDILQELAEGLGAIEELKARTRTLADDIDHLTKSTEDCIREYLARVCEEWVLYMDDTAANQLTNRVDFVITHPAVRSPSPFIHS
jgi:hypothetical protein